MKQKKKAKSSLTRRRLIENLIREEVEEELLEVKDIRRNVYTLKESLLEKNPSKFSVEDISYAMFGALLIGLGFLFKSALVTYSVEMTITHVNMVIISTLIFLTAEAYYLGYRRVKEKHERKVGSFLFKRVATLFFISLFVSLFLIYLFGVDRLAIVDHDPIAILKITATMTMCCATGAAISSIVKKY